MKVSEVMNVLRTTIEEVPAEMIYMCQYVSDEYGRMVPFRNVSDCGSRACVLGWGARTHQLAPQSSEYYQDPFWIMTDRVGPLVVNWDLYTSRILKLEPNSYWPSVPLYRVLFHHNAYPDGLLGESLKVEILERLKIAAEALIDYDEDVELAGKQLINELTLKGKPPGGEAYYKEFEPNKYRPPNYTGVRNAAWAGLLALIAANVFILIINLADFVK